MWPGHKCIGLGFDDSPLEMAQGMILENLHISPQFFRDVISGHTRADTSVLGFRDPDTLIAGNIHACFPAWEGIANIAPFKLTPEEFTLNPGPFHVTVLGSLFLTLLLTVCCLGLSPYGVRWVMSLLRIWLCL